MAQEVTQDEAVVLTGDQIEKARWLSIRQALKLEIKTGMRRSNRGPSTVQLANKITGCTSKQKLAAYKALNGYIVKHMGAEFDRPLPEATK